MLSTDYIKKKITVVCEVYFFNSSVIFATKYFLTKSVLKVRSFMMDILALLDLENVGGKMVYITFWVTMKKQGGICTYFLLKHDCEKEVDHFSVKNIQTKTM